MKLFFYNTCIELPASSILNVVISLSNLLPPNGFFHGFSVLVSLVVSFVFSVLLILVSTARCTASFQLTHFSPSPTVTLSCLWFLYLCYCIKLSRLSVLPNAHPLCDINIFSEVSCDQSSLVPQFWIFGGHGDLTLSEIPFTNFVLSMQTVV